MGISSVTFLLQLIASDSCSLSKTLSLRLDHCMHAKFLSGLNRHYLHCSFLLLGDSDVWSGGVDLPGAVLGTCFENVLKH
jgi:hypothetical protein